MVYNMHCWYYNNALKGELLVMKFTVGLVCFDEHQELERCLAALFCEDNLLYFNELVIVSNGMSLTDIQSILSNFKTGSVELKTLFNAQNNLGESRKIIVENCSNEFLCITDPDCVVSSKWLADYHEYIQLNDMRGVAGLSGAVIQDGGLSYLKSIQKTVLAFKSPQAMLVNKVTSIDHLQTSNSLFNVGAVKCVGSFSIAHERGGEDLELGFRLTTYGYKLFMIGNASVTHMPKLSIFKLIRRFYFLGFFQKNSFLFNRKIHLYIMFIFLLTLIGFVTLNMKATSALLLFGMLFYKLILSYLAYLSGFFTALLKVY